MQTDSCNSRALFCSLFHHRLNFSRCLDAAMRDNRTRSPYSLQLNCLKYFLTFLLNYANQLLLSVSKDILRAGCLAIWVKFCRSTEQYLTLSKFYEVRDEGWGVWGQKPLPKAGKIFFLNVDRAFWDLRAGNKKPGFFFTILLISPPKQ